MAWLIEANLVSAAERKQIRQILDQFETTANKSLRKVLADARSERATA